MVNIGGLGRKQPQAYQDLYAAVKPWASKGGSPPIPQLLMSPCVILSSSLPWQELHLHPSLLSAFYITISTQMTMEFTKGVIN